MWPHCGDLAAKIARYWADKQAGMHPNELKARYWFNPQTLVRFGDRRMRSTFGRRTQSFGGHSPNEINAGDSSDDCFDEKPPTKEEIAAQEAQLKKAQKTEDHPSLKIAKKFSGSWLKCVE